MDESITLKGNWVIVKTRTVIFGAGGGPLVSHRSKDGISWENFDGNN